MRINLMPATVVTSLAPIALNMGDVVSRNIVIAVRKNGRRYTPLVPQQTAGTYVE